MSKYKQGGMKGFMRCMLTLAVLMLTAFSGAAAAQEPVRGGVLKIALLGLDTADPHRHTGSIAVQQVYVEALTSIAGDGSVKPFLAEKIDVSPDGLTYTITVRSGVKFHNGREMNASDILANFERVKNQVTKGWLASAMEQVDSFQTEDANTFRIRMKAPYAPFLNLISELWILAPESEGWSSTITKPIGTGPFKFGTWSPNVKLIAPRHAEYWQKGLPYLDAVEFDLRSSSDNDLALRSGDLHIATVPQDRVNALGKDGNVAVRDLKDTGWFFWSFNNRKPNPPLDNVEVRKAIAYTMDKKAYMQFIGGDKAVVTNQMAAPGNVYFDQAIHDADIHVRPDIAKGKQILKEQGVEPEKITLKIVSWQRPYAEIAVQQIKQLGFKVNHLALDDLGAQNELGKYDWDVAPFSSGPRADFFMRYVRLMSDGPNPVLWGGIQDPELDALIRKAVTSVKTEDIRAAYLQAWKRIMDKYYTVVAGHSADKIGVRKEVQGYDTGFTWSQNRVDGGLAFTWLAK